jgi:hypothetical protein
MLLVFNAQNSLEDFQMNAFNVDSSNREKWSELLQQAVNEPGLILKAYSAFHGYSLGNQFAAMLQCAFRRIEEGPIDTYKGWQSKGRQVRKGEKAIWLCMPITRKKRKNEDSDEDEVSIACFVWRPNWFVLAQTDGEPVPMPEIPDWSKDRALAALHIEEIPFTETDGNVQGYALKSQIAISPVAGLPAKTMFHEVAHLCWLRSYVVLREQDLWNEATAAFEAHITFPLLDPVSASLLVLYFSAQPPRQSRSSNQTTIVKEAR